MRTIVFDVNETLLDLNVLSPEFERLFGTPEVAKTWFAQLLQSALVATVTNTYRDFSDLAAAALDTVAQEKKVFLSAADKDGVLKTMRELPAHEDVRPSLERLRAAGFRLATLTNSPYRTLHHQLENAGLSDLFDVKLSVDEVKLFKPHRAVYEMAAGRLGVEVGAMRMWRPTLGTRPEQFGRVAGRRSWRGPARCWAGSTKNPTSSPTRWKLW